MGPEGVRQGCLASRHSCRCRELTIVVHMRAIGPSASCPPWCGQSWCGGRVAWRQLSIMSMQLAALLERARGTVYEHHHDCDHSLDYHYPPTVNLTGWRTRNLLCPHHWSTTLKALPLGQIMSFFQWTALHCSAIGYGHAVAAASRAMYRTTF